MAQLINSDTGLLIEEGADQATYEDMDYYDPSVHQVVNAIQSFDLNRVPKREVWFYFPILNLFYQSTREEHAIVVAAKNLFAEDRWDDIEEALDEIGSIDELLNRLNLKKVKRKFQILLEKGLVTSGELQTLRDLVAHILQV